jgi:hypothetical protein
MLTTKKSVILAMMEANNKHDINAMTKLTTEDAVLVAGDTTLPWSAYMDAIAGVLKSFPDLTHAWDDLSEDGVFTNPRVIGTHTGDPFSLGPSMPAIPATGVKCSNHNERWEYTVEEGKVKKLTVVTTSEGALGGIPSFYVQIGGQLE